MIQSPETTRIPAAKRSTAAGRRRFAGLVLMLLAACGIVQAQEEPRVPCNDCPLRTFAPKPEDGLWNNPLDPTGTGLMLEVQGQRVAGFHFGYEETGEPLWLLISGALEAAPEESDALWVVESSLHRFSGGPCVTCPSRPAVVDGSEGALQIEFLSRNHARFRVDDGPWQRLISFTFGAKTENPFDEINDLPLPDLEGRWALVMQQNSPAGSEDPRSSRGSAQLVRVVRNESEPGQESMVRYRVFPTAEFGFVGTPPPLPQIGAIECTGSEAFGPVCDVLLTADNQLQPGFGLTFSARLSDISDSRWTAFDGNNRDIQAFRVDYD